MFKKNFKIVESAKIILQANIIVDVDKRCIAPVNFNRVIRSHRRAKKIGINKPSLKILGLGLQPSPLQVKSFSVSKNAAYYFQLHIACYNCFFCVGVGQQTYNAIKLRCVFFVEKEAKLV